MAKILVTGGSGFVGSNLIRRLLLKGYDVISVDDYSNGLKDNDSPDVQCLNFDISSKKNWQELDGIEIDAVYHLAAQSSNAISFQNPERDLLVNQLGTLNVIEFCSKHNIKRLIFTSSMSVYGNPSTIPTPPQESLRPDTYYAIHKASSERYIQISKGINWTIFRLYTTYGAGQNLANLEQGLVKIFLGYVLRGEPIRVHGSLDRKRDIIHVSDVVEALVTSLDKGITYQKIYNLGFGQTISVRDLIAKIVKGYLNSEKYPVIEESGDQGDPLVTQADINSIQKDIGWQPKISPQNGIEETLRKYRISNE